MTSLINCNYTTREYCIFCNDKLQNTYFKNDLTNFIGHYSVPYNFSINDYKKYHLIFIYVIYVIHYKINILVI
jgi:hypothetical protein